MGTSINNYLRSNEKNSTKDQINQNSVSRSPDYNKKDANQEFSSYVNEYHTTRARSVALNSGILTNKNIDTKWEKIAGHNESNISASKLNIVNQITRFYIEVIGKKYSEP